LRLRKYLVPLQQILYPMARKYVIVLVLICFSLYVNALNDSIKADLNRLNKTLLERPSLEADKRHIIDSLIRVAATQENAYNSYHQLLEEYKSYNYDTALIYIQFMESEATPQQMPELELEQAFVYLSGGLFKEASDILTTWLQRYETELPKFSVSYYVTHSRLMWDLADNVGGELGKQYNAEGIRLNRVLLTYLQPTDTAVYWYAHAVLDLREGNYDRGIVRCLHSLSATQPSVHYQAITASTLAYLYRKTGDNQSALHYYIEAAICDIRSLTYETVAMRNIAELLFEEGETKLADRYIHIAMQDAQRYHARHRQVGVAESLPIIEERLLSQSRLQQNIAILLLTIVAVLLLIGVIGILLLRRQNKAIRAAQQTIDDMNRRLKEANKLKEELLGTLLTSRSQYINDVRKYQQEVKQFAVNRQWNALMTIPKQVDAHVQRATLDRQLDAMLLSLYPTFVQDFNALLRPNEQLIAKKDEPFSPQLRIFALIRLGITQNEVIADILDYSVNTVYAYKTRVIAASDLSPEEFYRALMLIPSLSRTTQA